MPNKPTVVGRHGERATLRNVTRGAPRPQTSPRVYVEAWPDTEEDALEGAAAYRRGLKRERAEAGDRKSW